MQCGCNPRSAYNNLNKVPRRRPGQRLSVCEWGHEVRGEDVRNTRWREPGLWLAVISSGGLVLRGRRDERAVLDGLLEGARAGQSGVLVLRGEAGIGKTALLEYAIESASDLRVLRAVGVESEMELAFAALHQLCAPLLDRLDGLPGPQRDALADHVRIERRRGAGPLLRRPGGAWSVVRGGGGAPAFVRGR